MPRGFLELSLFEHKSDFCVYATCGQMWTDFLMPQILKNDGTAQVGLFEALQDVGAMQLDWP